MKYASMFMVALAIGSTSAACTADGPSIEGEARLAPQGEKAGAFFVIRAVPDHPDGFEPHRVYHGDEALFATFHADSIEFPFQFRLEGEETASMDQPWLLLAWFANEPTPEWIAPGQTFGAIQFEFTHVSHGASYADGLEVMVDETAPPP